MLRKNGERVDAEANVSVIKDSVGQPTAFLTVIRDVSERMKAESVLHKAQEELRQDATVFNAAHDAILTLDPEGTITYWNRGAERLYGWTKQEAKVKTQTRCCVHGSLNRAKHCGLSCWRADFGKGS